MATILNSVILNSTILDSAILVFPLKHTHMCQDWFSPFAQKNFTHTYLPNICTRKLHSFILTQLDDGGHLEFCHLEFNFCIVELRHLVFFSQIHSKTSPSTLILTQTNSFWLKLFHSHWTWWWQPSWILPTWFQPFCTKNITHSFWLNLMMADIYNTANLDTATAILDSDTLLSYLRFTQKHSPSNLTLTQTNSFCLKLIHFHLIDDGNHLVFCQVGLRHCHLGFRHLVIFSQIHSKHPHSTLTLILTNSFWLKLIHSHLTWW